MRALFLLLLLVNAGLLAWGYSNEQKREPAQRRIPPPMGELRLITEIEANPESRPTAAPKPNETAAGPQQTPAEPQTAAKSDEPPGQSATAAASPAAETPTDDAQEPVEAEPQQEPDQVAKQPAEDEPNEPETETGEDTEQKMPIVVKRETADATEQDDQGAPEAPTDEEIEARGRSSGNVERDTDGQCGVFGPVNDRTRVVNILGDLMKRGIAASILEQEPPKEPGYWLTTESVANAGEAEFLLGRLQRLGFKELSLELTEERRYVISFGHFENKDAARAFITRVRDAGFSVKIAEQNPGQGIFWIEFPLKTDLRPDTPTWSELTGKYQQLGPAQKRCGAVVTQR